MGETICAISTPPGIGGIAVVRISGTDAIAVADRVWKGKSLAGCQSHTSHLGTVLDSRDEPLDQAVATIFRGPRSFTGEDTVELSVHGSRYIQREILNSLIRAGARLADPGEFTRRAFASGNLDLAQAEAVADMIASNSRASHRLAINQMRGQFSRRLASLREQLVELTSLLELELDFSEEEVEFASREKLSELARAVHDEVVRLRDSFSAGAAIKDGIPVAILGETNAGKSSLLNAILGDDRAIVSSIHGTTRDVVEDTVEIGPYLFRFMDTAGLRETTDEIEQIGIERSHAAARRARVILYVHDSTLPLPASLPVPADDAARVLFVLNKADLAPEPVSETATTEPGSETCATERGSAEPVSIGGRKFEAVRISCKSGEGIESLKRRLVETADADAGDRSDVVVTNARHAEALSLAADSSARVLDALASGLPGDLVAQDLRETLHHLASITGAISTPEILSTIFSRFCIGK